MLNVVENERVATSQSSRENGCARRWFSSYVFHWFQSFLRALCTVPIVICCIAKFEHHSKRNFYNVCRCSHCGWAYDCPVMSLRTQPRCCILFGKNGQEMFRRKIKEILSWNVNVNAMTIIDFNRNPQKMNNKRWLSAYFDLYFVMSLGIYA